MTVQETNGTAPAMTQVADVLRAAAAEAIARRDQLAQELAIARREASNYERALALIETAGDAPPEPAPKKRGPRGPYAKSSKASAPALVRYQDAIRSLVEEQGDAEFRQIDIRERIGGESSAVSSQVFGELRKRGVVRVARKEGVDTFYRMTRAALADGDEQ